MSDKTFSQTYENDHNADISKMDTIYRQDAIDAMTTTLWHYPTECLRNINKYEFAKGLAELGLKSLPPAQPEWNNHTVACLLAELFDDTCACNYNGIDEWLPEKCEVIDACPHPVGVACWEQYLKYRAEKYPWERRTDE